MKKRLIAFTLMFAFMAFIFWIFGFDFDKRGTSTGFVTFCCFAFGILGFTYPFNN